MEKKRKYSIVYKQWKKKLKLEFHVWAEIFLKVRAILYWSSIKRGNTRWRPATREPPEKESNHLFSYRFRSLFIEVECRRCDKQPYHIQEQIIMVRESSSFLLVSFWLGAPFFSCFFRKNETCPCVNNMHKLRARSERNEARCIFLISLMTHSSC